MKRLVALLMLCCSFLFAEINLQTASKEELMGIKGIGEKKAEQIIEYRKTNTINKAEDLKNIKGFGDNIVGNVKDANPISKEKLINKNLQEAMNIGLLEDKKRYFKTEIEILEIFDELLKYDISLELVEEYINTSKKLALLEKELSQKVFDKTGTIPEILVLNILNSLKPYIFNKQTILELKRNK